MKKVKLHLGCGGFYKEGYINIDKYPKGISKVDRAFDCNNPLDYADESVDEILAIHLFEHLKRSGLNRTVKSWYRVLKKRGKLILELPNAHIVMNKYLADAKNERFDEADEFLKWIFGTQEKEGKYHFTAWTPVTLAHFFDKFGFSKVSIGEGQDDTRPVDLCMRLEATK